MAPVGARVAIMYSDAALMRAIVAGFKYQAPRSKISIVSDMLFPQGSSDATVQAAQVKAQNPDYVIVIGAGAFDNVLTNQLLDLGVKASVIEKSGSWFSFNSQRIGQGRDNVREFLKANKDIAADIEARVRGAKDVVEEQLLVGPPEEADDGDGSL